MREKKGRGREIKFSKKNNRNVCLRIRETTRTEIQQDISLWMKKDMKKHTRAKVKSTITALLVSVGLFFFFLFLSKFCCFLVFRNLLQEKSLFVLKALRNPLKTGRNLQFKDKESIKAQTALEM